MARPQILPKHVEFLDTHFSNDPDWKGFKNRLRSPSFREAVRTNPNTDRKLKRFVRMVGMRQESKSRGVDVPSDRSGKYTVRYHPEVNRFSCTCGDWTYKRSTRNRGPKGDCKHISRLKTDTKKTMKKVAGSIIFPFLLQSKMEEDARKANVRNKAFKKNFPPQESLVSQYLKQASVIGRAAESLRRR